MSRRAGKSGCPQNRKAHTMSDATVKDVMAFFSMKPSEFTKEWRALSDQDKAALKAGIGDASLTY